MFLSEKYLTRGVNEAVPILLQLIMWKMISDIPSEKDYLQIFRLVGKDGIQIITHEQEQPEYRKTIVFEWYETVTQKVYVIDDGDHCTMLLAEEY